VCNRTCLSETARVLGYRHVVKVVTLPDLADALDTVKDAEGPVFVEVMCNLASRADLGRPASTPIENKNELMAYLSEV